MSDSEDADPFAQIHEDHRVRKTAGAAPGGSPNPLGDQAIEEMTPENSQSVVGHDRRVARSGRVVQSVAAGVGVGVPVEQSVDSTAHVPHFTLLWLRREATRQRQHENRLAAAQRRLGRRARLPCRVPLPAAALAESRGLRTRDTSPWDSIYCVVSCARRGGECPAQCGNSAALPMVLHMASKEKLDADRAMVSTS